MKIPPALKKEIMGVPLFVWIGLILIAVAIGMYLRRRRSEVDIEAEPVEEAGYYEDEEIVTFPPVSGIDDWPPDDAGNEPPNGNITPPVIIIPNPCAYVKCPPGFEKKQIGGKCKCVKEGKKPPSKPCRNVKCPPGFEKFEENGKCKCQRKKQLPEKIKPKKPIVTNVPKTPIARLPIGPGKGPVILPPRGDRVIPVKRKKQQRRTAK